MKKVKKAAYPFNRQNGTKAKGDATMKRDSISEGMKSSRTYEVLESNCQREGSRARDVGSKTPWDCYRSLLSYSKKQDQPIERLDLGRVFGQLF